MTNDRRISHAFFFAECFEFASVPVISGNVVDDCKPTTASAHRVSGDEV